MTLYYPDYERGSFFRPPHWRWERACELIDHGRYFSRQRDDEDTGRAVHYIRALARCRDGAPSPRFLQRFGDIHAARQLHQEGGATRLLIQAWLLARQTSQQISTLTGISPQVIDAYEALFYHCREFLNTRDWITCQCVISTNSANEPAHAVLLQAYAYHGGPLVLEAVRPYLLDGKDLFDPPVDLSTPEGRKEQLVRLSIAVHALPDDAATNNRLFKIMLILQEKERKARLCAPATKLLGENLAFGLDKLPQGVPDGLLTYGKIPYLAADTQALREAA